MYTNIFVGQIIQYLKLRLNSIFGGSKMCFQMHIMNPITFVKNNNYPVINCPSMLHHCNTLSLQYCHCYVTAP